MNVIYCHTFVSPGMGAALQTFFFFNVLMIDDLPTFGYLHWKKFHHHPTCFGNKPTSSGPDYLMGPIDAGPDLTQAPLTPVSN